ncbi:hypothetical protein BDW59DRAFT_164181 [Aspergillus cavernicola]|uniref:Uncharacterized protein n=1 Tax=Aspergillus cavernicola TaxID=176166 RepID=A0ABR4I174_9EURO
MPKLENSAVDRRFWGTITDIGQSHAYYSKPVPMDRILTPDASLDELMADSQPNNIREDERLVRWIHLPENNVEWVEILMIKVLETPEAVANVLRSDLWSNRVRGAEKTIHARCLRPVCADFSRDLATTARNRNNRTMLVIPYLHWGTNREWLKLKNTVHLIQNGDNSLPGNTSMIYECQHRHRKLLKSYLNGDRPLHIRRTLDQFYYLSLDDKDMEFRDTHQTVSEHFQKNSNRCRPTENKTGDIDDFPILMVDQLCCGFWVMVSTVITSFPHKWSNTEGFDPYNMTEILAAVERRLVTKEWPIAVESGQILAELIANECSGIMFDIAKYRDRWLQVREIYENAIGDVANKESELFRTFSSSLKTPRNWGARGVEKERYAIGEEVELLGKIKDIRDELNMIRTIFQMQKMVLEDSALFKILQMMVDKRIKELDNIDQHASQAHEALKHILDLKQKQANAEEAHFLSVQNIESAKQGQAIMTFTIVTIIFAPLSFLTSFFALQIVEFPTLTIGFVLEIIFPITVFVVIIWVIYRISRERCRFRRKMEY